MLLAAMILQGWRPGPADFGPIGWIIFSGYLATTLVAWRLSRLDAARGLDPWPWRALAIACVVLALNQRLSLHNAITVAGRDLAQTEGWYKVRRPIQVVLLAGWAIASYAAVAWLFGRSEPPWRKLRWPWAGMVFLVTFIGIRTASFHYLDRYLDRYLVLRLFQVSWFPWHTLVDLIGVITLVVLTLVAASAGPASRSSIKPNTPTP